MRAIDGDELIKRLNLAIAILKKQNKNLDVEDDAESQMELKAYRDIRDSIKEMPTIKPKKGRWILTEDDDYEYCTCSECGYQNGENWMNGSDIPFCAMCGADMRGDDHEND